MPKRAPFDLKTLHKLEPRKKRYDYRDATPGLVLRVTPTGAKTFCWVHRVGSRVERVRLADLAEVESIEDMRQLAREYNASLGRGENPAEKRRAVSREMTLAELWSMYLERHAKVNKRAWQQDEQRWNKHLKSAWGSRPLSTIRRAEVVHLLERIKAKAGPVQANRVRALLHTMFAKGQSWGLELTNPATGTPRNRETAKERYLAPKELRAFIRAAQAEPDSDVRDHLLLLLFTGVRGHTLRAARWADINLRDGVWNIPPAAMKAGRPLTLPLASPVVEMLTERRELLPAAAEYVFPSPRASEGHLHNLPRTGWLRVLKAAELPDLTPHTLRRTFATYAVGAGTPIEVIGRALGHTQPGGITAIYARIHPDIVRRAVEATVRAMIAVAEVSDEQAEVLAFPVPDLATIAEVN